VKNKPCSPAPAEEAGPIRRGGCLKRILRLGAITCGLLAGLGLAVYLLR